MSMRTHLCCCLNGFNASFLFGYLLAYSLVSSRLLLSPAHARPTSSLSTWVFPNHHRRHHNHNHYSNSPRTSNCPSNSTLFASNNKTHPSHTQMLPRPPQILGSAFANPFTTATMS
ncbi:hypothetical protein IWZ03DRAFT_92256 [Phyllosticta citriasiana]|uniref:Secreted protein n=1 Tax=Phyllosticta citriasiana TaxID=595635 RepID=A0ABR1K844_9PEZI